VLLIETFLPRSFYWWTNYVADSMGAFCTGTPQKDLVVAEEGIIDVMRAFLSSNCQSLK